MTQHLFLDGMIQIGKSTLLRELLKPYMNEVGGFTCQRLTNKDGRTVAFRLGPAAETPLHAPYNKDCDHIFRRVFPDCKAENDLSVFTTVATFLLQNSKEKSLILLDEIGGVELSNKIFREELYDVLNGSVPCLGVIKLANKAKHMSSEDSISIYQRNLDLRNYISDHQLGEILHYESDSLSVHDKVETFIKNIFHD